MPLISNSPHFFFLTASPEEQDDGYGTRKISHRDVSELYQLLVFPAPLYSSLCPISANKTVTSLWISPATLFSPPGSCRSPNLSPHLAFGHEDITLTPCPSSPSQKTCRLALVPTVSISITLPRATATRVVTCPLSLSLYISTQLMSPLIASLPSSCLYNQHFTSSLLPVTSIMGLASEMLLEINFCLSKRTGVFFLSPTRIKELKENSKIGACQDQVTVIAIWASSFFSL